MAQVCVPFWNEVRLKESNGGGHGEKTEWCVVRVGRGGDDDAGDELNDAGGINASGRLEGDE